MSFPGTGDKKTSDQGSAAAAFYPGQQDDEDRRRREEEIADIETQQQQLQQQLQALQVKVKVNIISSQVSLFSAEKYGSWLPGTAYQNIKDIFGQNLDRHAMKRVAAVSQLLFNSANSNPTVEIVTNKYTFPLKKPVSNKKKDGAFYTYWDTESKSLKCTVKDSKNPQLPEPNKEVTVTLTEEELGQEHYERIKKKVLASTLGKVQLLTVPLSSMEMVPGVVYIYKDPTKAESLTFQIVGEHDPISVDLTEEYLGDCYTPISSALDNSSELNSEVTKSIVEIARDQLQSLTSEEQRVVFSAASEQQPELYLSTQEQERKKTANDNCRKDREGNPVKNANQDFNILALVYLIASKEIHYGGNEISPMQAAWASSERMFDKEYEQAVDLFISYLNGTADYETLKQEFNVMISVMRRETGLENVAKSLNQAFSTTEDYAYTSVQSMRILATLKSSADLIGLEMDSADLNAAIIDERCRAINALNKQLVQLNERFNDFAHVQATYAQPAIDSTVVSVNKAHEDAAIAYRDIMLADRLQAASMPLASLFYPPVSKAKIGAHEAKVKLIVAHNRGVNFFDRDTWWKSAADPKYRAYHAVWEKGVADGKPLHLLVIDLMKDYSRPTLGIFTTRTHASRALGIIEDINKLSADLIKTKGDPNKEKVLAKALGEIVDDWLNKLDNKLHNKEETYSAFRARCHFILNELNKKCLEGSKQKNMLSSSSALSPTSEENAELLAHKRPEF